MVNSVGNTGLYMPKWVPLFQLLETKLLPDHQLLVALLERGRNGMIGPWSTGIKFRLALMHAVTLLVHL